MFGLAPGNTICEDAPAYTQAFMRVLAKVGRFGERGKGGGAAGYAMGKPEGALRVR